MFEILFLFLHRRSQLRAGMTVYFQVFRVASPTRSTYAAPVLLWHFGFITFFESCWVRVPVHGMQGGWKSERLKRAAFQSLSNP
jgi:hypothetical protein